MVLVALMMCFVCNEAYAYDIYVKNADGVTIYYNYINEGKELAVTSGRYSGTYSGSVVIPEEVTFMNRTRKVTSKVTSIGYQAFYYCSGLTSVTIPNSVTSIGEWAFYCCTGLTSVTIPGSVTSIGSEAFRGCSGLTSVTIPGSVTSIGDYAFYGCSGLTSVAIPNSVTSIGEWAFRDCSGLTSVHITDLAAWCKITFGDNPLRYAHHLYLNNQEITDLVIPESVTSIGEWAFEGCSGLTSVTIPGSVTSIVGGAFEGCNLGSVISLIEEPFAIQGKEDEDFRTFSLNTFNNATLYVPSGTIDKYKATEGWQDFFFIEEGDGGGGITDAVTEVKAMPVLIQSEGNGLTIEGAEAGTAIRVYDLSGRLIGSTTAVEGATRVNVAAAAEKVVIVKVGERSVKVRR